MLKSMTQPMPRPLKIILLIVSGLVGLLVLIAVGVHFFVDVNAYKPQLETVASEALGMEVKIGGPLRIDLFPGLHLTLEDVHLRNRRADLASAKAVSLNIALIPLLHRAVRIEKIGLKSPAIFLEKGADGKLNIGVPEQAGGTFSALNLGTVSFTDGTLRYTDKQSGSGFEAGHCDLDMRQFRLAAGKSTELLKLISFTAQLACAEIRDKDIAVSDSQTGRDACFRRAGLGEHTGGFFRRRSSLRLPICHAAVPHRGIHQDSVTRQGCGRTDGFLRESDDAGKNRG
jgi:uncharacterized protein involved in outer membrane biogenesis